MRMPVFILFTFSLFSPVDTRADDTTAINSLIDQINAGIKTNKPRMIRILVINTDVAADTLEAEKRQTGFSYGEVYVAHSLALASHRTFKQIATMKAGGQTWSGIARILNVSLKGSTAAIKEMLNE